MIAHYNAFISYKHAPLDTRVASEIQTRLERFRIPKAIRKATGIQKIDRIFRDKEELLITSDLNDTIEQALLHSDYLIVICSHATKESVWVQKEIEFFLKTHPKEKVLTVVAEGEPVDVVPKILQQQEVTVTLDTGEEETVVMPIEPLSCDYRGDFRKARKEELPRLAAAMLGCSYDELKQRQRQYRVRRMAAAFSAVAVLLAALSVYYAWSANQIKENYLQSLRNQSQYLSAESLSLLEQGDRINAMLLSLEALPKDSEDERPVLPEAEYALSKAVNAYVSPNTNWYAVEYSFPHGGQIDRILPSADETRLAVVHSGYTFTLWNVQTREKLMEKTIDYIRDSAVSVDDRLLLLTSQSLYCYDMRDGALLWQTETRNPVTYTSAEAFCVSETAPLVAYVLGSDLVIADTGSGEAVQKIPMPTYEDTDLFGETAPHAYQFNFAKFSPDNKKLFLHLEGDKDLLAYCDLEAQTVTLSGIDFYVTEDAVFTEDGNVIFIGMYRIRNGNYWVRPLYYYEDGYSDVGCMDPQGQLLWAYELHYTEMDVGLGSEVHSIPYTDKDGNETPAVVAVSGEKMVFLDPAAGNVLEEHAYTASIVTLSVYDEHISTTLTDGMLGQYVFSDHLNMAGDFCIEDIDLAADNERLFVSNSETGNVLLYTYALHDDNWIEMPVTEDVKDSFYSFDKEIAGNTILLSRYEGLEVPFVVIDTESLTARVCCLSEDFLENKSFLRLSPDGKALLFEISDSTGYDFDDTSLTYTSFIGGIDLATMEYDPQYYTLPTLFPKPCFYGNNIYCIDSTPNENGQHQYELLRQTADGTNTRWSIPLVVPDASLMSNFLQLTKQQDMALVQEWLYNQAPCFHTLDLQTGETHHTEPIQAQSSVSVLAAWSGDGQQFFLAGENCIIAFDRSCNEVYRISCHGMTPGSLFASGEDLFVLYGSNVIYRYRASDGAFLNKIEMNNGNVSVMSDCRWDDSRPGTLALFNNDTLNLIDTERWVVRTQIKDCLSFDLEKGLVFTAQSSFDNRLHFGYYVLYSYEDLIVMAKQQLGDTALSAEMQAKYGIS